MSDAILFNELLSYLARAKIKAFVKEKYNRNACYYSGDELTNFIANEKEPSFNAILFSFIDRKGVKDAEIYKKAGLDRRHFSKIRSNPDYQPGKSTVLALAVALELNGSEAERLLVAAGYSLSKSDDYDLVVRFYLERKIFDLAIINDALDRLSLKPLAGVLE